MVSRQSHPHLGCRVRLNRKMPRPVHWNELATLSAAYLFSSAVQCKRSPSHKDTLNAEVIIMQYERIRQSKFWRNKLCLIAGRLITVVCAQQCNQYIQVKNNRLHFIVRCNGVTGSCHDMIFN